MFHCTSMASLFCLHYLHCCDMHIRGCQSRPSGTESETEEDMLATLLDPDKHYVGPDTHLSLQAYQLFK